MPLRVDPEKIEQALAEMATRTQPMTTAPGLQGVMARMQLNVMPVLTRWRVSEQNRTEADPEEVGNALIGLFATAIASEVAAVYGPGVSDEHFDMVNRFLGGIAEEVGAMLTGTHPGTITHMVAGTEAGAA